MAEVSHSCASRIAAEALGLEEGRHECGRADCLSLSSTGTAPHRFIGSCSQQGPWGLASAATNKTEPYIICGLAPDLICEENM